MTTNAPAETPAPAAPLAVGLIRDAEGRPILDRPLSDYPPHIRAALESLMTSEEIENAA